MTPQEQADSIVRKYVDLFKKSDTCFGDCKNTVACQQSWYQCEEWYRHAIECVLIAVDLHLEELSKMKLIFSDRELHLKHWQEVKQELQKL
jgi:hypothetical protein